MGNAGAWPRICATFKCGRGASWAAFPRGALIVIHKSLRASGASTISVVGADLSAKAGTSDKDPASESQYSRTSPLPLSGTAFLQVDLCITMSAERRNDQRDLKHADLSVIPKSCCNHGLLWEAACRRCAFRSDLSVTERTPSPASRLPRGMYSVRHFRVDRCWQHTAMARRPVRGGTCR